MEPHYSEIIPGLWLGDMFASQDAKFFASKRIGAVLNCTPDVPHHYLVDHIEYMRIPVDDDLTEEEIEKMREYMSHAISFLYKNRNIEKKNVFVHCHAGIQRSAICVVGYLIKTTTLNKKNAIAYVIKKRPVAFFGGRSINFINALP